MRRQRTAGRVSAMAGYLVASAASHLGGQLVYQERIGTDHANRRPIPDDFVAVLPEVALEEGKPARVELRGTPIVLVRKEQQVFALGDTCAHQGGPLSEGKVEDTTISCPWHGSVYCLETGQVERGPSTFDQPVYEARIYRGQVEVRMAISNVSAPSLDTPKGMKERVNVG